MPSFGSNLVKKGLLTMKRTRKFLIAASLLLGLIFVFVPKPGIAGRRRGLRYQFTMISPVDSTHLRFADQFVNAVFKLGRKKIAFSFSNRSSKPIKIHWENVAYIDSTGQTHKSLHQEAITIVPPTATIKDSIVPMDYIYSQMNGRLGPQQRGIEFLPKASKKEAQAYDGRSFSVVMPIEEDGVIKNYLFSFRIHIVET